MAGTTVRSKRSIPRPASTLHRGVSTFRPKDGAELLGIVPFAARKGGIWLAEALNDVLMNYLVTFARVHPTAPSGQAEWACKLRELSDECLDMIVPGFSPDFPPRRVAPGVYSALFHNGTPEGIAQAHLRWLGFEDEWDAVEKISSALWVLRTFARNSEERWTEQKAQSMSRKKVRPGLLAWVADLGRVYARAFGRMPSYSTSDGMAVPAFVRFGDKVRRRVLESREVVTEGGTDLDAYAELEGFDAQKLARFAKSHAVKLRPHWKSGLGHIVAPDSFKLGIASENAPDDLPGD